MANYGLIGSDTPIDDLLSQYFPGAPDNLLYEMFESEQAALMAAILMELRGDDVDQDVTGQEEAVYFAMSDVAVTSTSESEIEWDFSADTVVVWGFDAPLKVAYKGTNKSNRDVPLTANEAPFSLSPPDGLRTASLWYSKQNADDADTTLNVLALK